MSAETKLYRVKFQHHSVRVGEPGDEGELFGNFPTKEAAQKAARSLRRRRNYVRVWVAEEAADGSPCEQPGPLE